MVVQLILAIACLAIVPVSSYKRESCSIFSLNTAKFPRLDFRQFDGFLLYASLLYDIRSVDPVTNIKGLALVNRNNEFEFHEVGKIRGTETCGANSYLGVGKTAFDDPCQPTNITRPVAAPIGDILYIHMNKKTLGVAVCIEKKNGICVDGFLCILTREFRISPRRQNAILQFLEPLGIYEEFGITRRDMVLVDQRVNREESIIDIETDGTYYKFVYRAKITSQPSQEKYLESLESFHVDNINKTNVINKMEINLIFVFYFLISLNIIIITDKQTTSICFISSPTIGVGIH